MLRLASCRYRASLVRLSSRARPGLVVHRTFIGALIQALTAPMDTIQQINDTKQFIQKTADEMVDSYEKTQIPRTNTFAPVPGFYNRPVEEKYLGRCLATQPSFLVLFGSSSVGKTAILRQVLSNDILSTANSPFGQSQKFILMHLDLRVAGFSDIAGLALRLATQFEEFFGRVIEESEEDGVTPGLQSLYKEKFHGHQVAFRQLRKQLVQRIDQGIQAGIPAKDIINSGDISTIMEQLQNALISYWDFDVDEIVRAAEKANIAEREDNKAKGNVIQKEKEERKREHEKRLKNIRASARNIRKRIPVILIDEAHRLPALIDDVSVMKSILDAFLVITKQENLCHVIHTVSDPFYMHWLQKVNVAQHAKIITLGDCSYAEAKDFYYNDILPRTVDQSTSPGALKYKVPEFDDVWNVFGGRLSHISDFMMEFINADGNLSPLEASRFVQSYTLVQLYLTHDGFVGHSELPGKVSTLDYDYNKLRSLMEAFINQVPVDNDGSRFNRRQMDYVDSCKTYGTDVVNAAVSSKIFDIAWTQYIPEVISSQAGTQFKLRTPKLTADSRVLENALEIVIAEVKDSNTTI